MGSAEEICCCLHGRDVQCLSQAVAGPSGKYIFLCPGLNLVSVDLFYGTQAAVKTLRYHDQLRYGNIIRKILIQVSPDPFRIRPAAIRQVKVCNLPHCMHPRIRPARSMHFHRTTGHTLQHLFQPALNRILSIALLLPSVIPGAFILYDHFIILTHYFLFLFKKLPAACHALVNYNNCSMTVPIPQLFIHRPQQMLPWYCHEAIFISIS